MQIEFKKIKDSKTGFEGTFESTVYGILNDVIPLFGLKSMSIYWLRVNNMAEYRPDKYTFFDKVPQNIKLFATYNIQFLANLMGLMGYGEFTATYDPEKSTALRHMWGVDDNMRPIAGDTKTSPTDVPDDAKYKDLVTTGSSEQIAEYYNAIAAMLPVEGRDYQMHAELADDGHTVKSSPEAYTVVGALWVKYLASTLPEYLKASSYEEKEAILNRHWNYVEQK